MRKRDKIANTIFDGFENISKWIARILIGVAIIGFIGDGYIGIALLGAFCLWFLVRMTRNN